MKQVLTLILLSLVMAACGGSSGGFHMSNTPADDSAQIPDFDFTDSTPDTDIEIPYPVDEPAETTTTTSTSSTSTSTTVNIVTTTTVQSVTSTTIRSPKIASTTTTTVKPVVISTTTTTLPEEIVVIAPPNPQKEKPVEDEFDPAAFINGATKEDFVGFNMLSPTIYFKAIIDEADAKYACNEADKISVIQYQGKEIAKLCPKTYAQCKLEGSCAVTQGNQRIPLNVRGEQDALGGRIAFDIIDVKRCPFGYGVQGSCLDPYYTVAADLSIYKPGDVIFVPDLVGIDMGNGEKHHGFFIIRDRGYKILGRGRFDFFTGYDKDTDSKNLFKKFKLGDVKTKMKYYLVKNPSKLNKFIKGMRNYPHLKRSQID